MGRALTSGLPPRCHENRRKSFRINTSFLDQSRPFSSSVVRLRRTTLDERLVGAGLVPALSDHKGRPYDHFHDSGAAEPHGLQRYPANLDDLGRGPPLQMKNRRNYERFKTGPLCRI